MKQGFVPMGVVALVFFAAVSLQAAPPLPGAIFTTNDACTGVNLNIYRYKEDVYLDGGPGHLGAAGLPEGWYYVQVTEPNGDLLGASVEYDPVLVDWVPALAVYVKPDGDFLECYQLSAILKTASDNFANPGYDSTTNPGGEYKVWVSNDPWFINNSTKTDNFKVKEVAPPFEELARLKVFKFYDVNADGIYQEATDILIPGWLVAIVDSIWVIRETPVDILLEPDSYDVIEATPLETNWIHTTPPCVPVDLESGEVETVLFGNVCLGAGGGRTLGYWSNKNGLAAMMKLSNPLAMLSALNLRNASGSDFNPTTFAMFQSWLLAAKATNMANMLSAQLAAMRLNVAAGYVSGAALVYAPGSTAANPLGFVSVTALMDEANTSLGLYGIALAGSPVRAYQEALKCALDEANNNRTFVQAEPCTFTFYAP